MVFEILSPKLQSLIKEKGLIEPTLPQKLGIQEILSGKNVLVIAQTGLGKTEAACLGLFDKIAAERLAPIALLYITPLRALNRDLLDRLVWWADKLELEIAVRHGDTPQSERAAQSAMPPHILITTPETLQAILPGKRMREHLKNVKHVIVDEIHELVESKRGIQLSLALERLRELAGNFQRIGLSATVGSPEKVAEFLGEDVKIIRAEQEKEYNIRVMYPKPGGKEKLMADELVVGEETAARLLRLAELIQSHKGVLAFTNTRETAEVISSRLRKMDKGLLQDVHHGSLSKERRIKSEYMFKKQELKSLICTSSLELGIDIGSIDLVVQYLSPRQVTRLVQRVGRSGHRVGETSRGIILSGGEDLFESIIIASNAAKKRLEEVKIHEYALDVLANQVIGLTMDSYDIGEEKIYSIVKRAYPYRNMKKDELAELVKFLESLRNIWVNNSVSGLTIRRRKRSFQYYFENLSMIPDTVQYRVISVIEHEPIGMLDEEFVAEHGQPGEKFVCSGRAWKIVQVENQKVMVEPIEDIESAIPAWEGELIPVPFEIAQEVGSLRRFIASGEKDLVGEIKERYNADTESARTIIEIIKRQKQTHPVPDDENFLMETYKNFVIIHSCCGSLVNDTIARYLSAVITERSGVSVNLKTDPYRIMLQTIYKPEKIKEILESYEGNLLEVLTASLQRSSLFKWRFLHIARRFGIISKAAKFEKINLGKIVSQYEGTPVYRETLREILLDKADAEKAEEILRSIAKGGIKLKLQAGLSYLGELGLTQQFSEVMKPLMPEKEIFQAFKRRLMLTRVRLLCVNCGEYNLIKTVRDVEENPDCPKCGSRLIAVLRRGQINAADIIKKKLKRKELTEEEMRVFQTIRRSADLVIVYGRRAVMVLAGRGIGPQTAARILANLQPTREKLLRDILAAEKEFVRTHKYWK